MNGARRDDIGSAGASLFHILSETNWFPCSGCRPSESGRWKLHDLAGLLDLLLVRSYVDGVGIARPAVAYDLGVVLGVDHSPAGRFPALRRREVA